MHTLARAIPARVAAAALLLAGAAGCDVKTSDRDLILLDPPGAVDKLNARSGMFVKETVGCWVDPRSAEAYAKGHIAGAINPVSRNKRSYWVGPDRYPADPEAWLAQATEQPGSWWREWADWLDGHRGALRAAPASLGARGFRVLEPAPGSYVKTRAPQ